MSANELLTEKRGKSYWITFNRPKRRNAITPHAYALILKALKASNADPDTTFTVFTGEGSFFTSGNDFGPAMFEQRNDDSIEKAQFYELIEALIDHKKIVICLVNGPAIGIGCTMLSLADLVVAADSAYFLCPFTQMGLCPEGTSSTSFAELMGYQHAARLAMFSEKMTAQEALQAGYIAKILPSAKYTENARNLVAEYEKTLAPQSLLITKALLRGEDWKKRMHAANEAEKLALEERFVSEEALERIAAKFGSKL